MTHYWILKLRAWNYSDDYVDDISGKFALGYPFVMFVAVFITGGGDNFPSFLLWLGVFWFFYITIFFTVVDTICIWRLEIKLNKTIYKELNSNMSLKKYYDDLEFNFEVPKKR